MDNPSDNRQFLTNTCACGQSFVGGIVSFQVLTRPQFSTLMSKIFPFYFSMQTVLPIVMAITYPGSRTSLVPSGTAGVLDSSNRWSVLAPIVAIFASGLANLAVIGPATTRCMDERKRQGMFDLHPT